MKWASTYVLQADRPYIFCLRVEFSGHQRSASRYHLYSVTPLGESLASSWETSHLACFEDVSLKYERMQLIACRISHIGRFVCILYARCHEVD